MRKQNEDDSILYRNALMLLSYWDIYKQYYSIRAEIRGYYIRPKFGSGWQVSEIIFEFGHAGNAITVNSDGTLSETFVLETNNWDRIILKSANGYISNGAVIRDTLTAWWQPDDIGSISHSGDDLIITNDGRYNEHRTFNFISSGLS